MEAKLNTEIKINHFLDFADKTWSRKRKLEENGDVYTKRLVTVWPRHEIEKVIKDVEPNTER